MERRDQRAQRAYTYDLDGNRTSKVEGGVTFSYTYDRVDQLATVIKTEGSTRTFSYDAYGNLTGNAESAIDVTTYAYDLADRLTAITPASGASATFTLDALGRFRTRVLSAGGTDTYSYLGTGEQVVRIANSSGTTTDSILDPAGNRLGVKQAGTVSWLVPDLHGSVAGSLSVAATTLTGAIRYDGYGQTVDSDQPGSTGSGYFGYQGRLDISPSGTALYDMSARFYAPGLGTFTQLDSYGGEVANPASMNRYLYAQANPATLIDPTGHRAEGCAGQDCSAIILANQQKARAKQKQSSTTRPSLTNGASNTTASASTSAPHVNSSTGTPRSVAQQGAAANHAAGACDTRYIHYSVRCQPVVSVETADVSLAQWAEAATVPVQVGLCLGTGGLGCVVVGGVGAVTRGLLRAADGGEFDPGTVALDAGANALFVGAGEVAPYVASGARSVLGNSMVGTAKALGGEPPPLITAGSPAAKAGNGPAIRMTDLDGTAAGQAGAGAETLSGQSRAYVDITRGSSVRNVGTNATHNEFADTLTQNGWVSRQPAAGVWLFEKDGAKYALKQRAATWPGWSADFTPAGSVRYSLKLRLGYQ